MLTVACVLRSGGIYDALWVSRLRAQIRRHLTIEHEFVIVCDFESGVGRGCAETCAGDTVHTVADFWPGWWAKIELFKPDRFEGPVLYFDLDTMPVGNLSDIARAAEAHDFIMLRDFYRSEGLGSGVMAWRSQDVVAPIYEAFAVRPKFFMECYRAGGDQSFVESCVNLKQLPRWQDVLPDQIVSYKVHCRAGIPPNARVICLHGKPKFSDMPANDAVRQAWEMAA